MATLLDLERAGAVSKLDPGLPPGTQEERLIYASPRLQAWLQGPLLALQPSWSSELSPAEQLASLVEEFCAGRNLMVGWHFNALHHVSGGMWKLKTADVRVFGWFARRDCFVGVAAEGADRLKRMAGMYAGYAGEVDRFRNNLDLDQPKFVEGTDPDGVVSNYAFP